MTIVWVLFWLVITGGVLGYLGWSIDVTLAQKKAWRAFAEKYKLGVDGGLKFLDPVFVTGAISGRRLNVYAQTELGAQQRTRNVYTHIEVFLNNLPPVSCLISKHVPPQVLRDFILPEVFTSSDAAWPAVAWAQCDDKVALASWMTPARMNAFKQLMDEVGKGDEALLVCDGEQSFILWRTATPMRDPRVLNAFVQKLFAIAKSLDA